MLHAELRGKASPEDTYAEDALTSTVFGTLFAVGEAAVPVLRAWLAKARPADEATPAWPTIAGVDNYWFWPRLRAAGDAGGEVEPDLVIECDGLLVVIEAKFLSGKSGRAAEREDQQAAIADQLVREWRSVVPVPGAASAPPGTARRDGLAPAIARCARRVLVYLVKRSHAVKAEHELAASLAAAGALAPRPAFYLLHWEHLDEVLTAASLVGVVPRWQQELRALLYRRGIAAFRGVGAAIDRDRVADLGQLVAWRRSWRPAARVRRAFPAHVVPLLSALARRPLRFRDGGMSPRRPR